MSNTANESQDDDHITVSKIYETLKSGPYLKKLYWEVLSDLKEKDTFKKMRKATEKLLNKKSEDLTNLTDSESDSLLRKTIVAEICSMSYAIDTVYSKILFIKLQKEFKTHIIEAIKDLKRERKIPDSVWCKLQIADEPEAKGPAENSAANNSIQQKPEASGRPIRMKRRKVTSFELATKNREIRSEIHEDLKAINCDEGKKDISRKNRNAGNQAVKKKATSLPLKNTSKKKQAEENQMSSKLNTFTKTIEDEVIPKDDMQFDNPGSDAESEVSVGNASLPSVSSVHTSDLSSFDDEISLSSEDGENGTKRKYSLKELKEMSNNGVFSSKFNGLLSKNSPDKDSSKKIPPAHKEKQIEDNSKKRPPSHKEKQIEESSKKRPPAHKEKQIEDSSKKKPSAHKEKQIEDSSKKIPPAHKEKQIEPSLNKADRAAENTDSSTEVKSPSPKTLPKRIRKPNSKYSSDSVLCTIKKGKERKKTPVEVRNDVPLMKRSSNEKKSKDVKTPCDLKSSSDSNQLSKKRAKSDASDSDAEAPSKTMKLVAVKGVSNSESEFTSPPPQCKSSELYKPHFAVHSLTSRKTAPVTLYST